MAVLAKQFQFQNLYKTHKVTKNWSSNCALIEEIISRFVQLYKNGIFIALSFLQTVVRKYEIVRTLDVPDFIFSLGALTSVTGIMKWKSRPQNVFYLFFRLLIRSIELLLCNVREEETDEKDGGGAQAARTMYCGKNWNTEGKYRSFNKKEPIIKLRHLFMCHCIKNQLRFQNTTFLFIFKSELTHY